MQLYHKLTCASDIEMFLLNSKSVSNTTISNTETENHENPTDM